MSIPGDFNFSFDHQSFPPPPPLPSSADLFSPSETTDLLGFLDEFDTFQWENNETVDPYYPQQSAPLDIRHTPYTNPHLTQLEPDHHQPRRSARSVSARTAPVEPPQLPSISLQGRASSSRSSSITSDSSATLKSSSSATKSGSKSRPLLSTPQKRLNHIMSEQKRRNAIRDGYAQLIALMTPAGVDPNLGMPTRGRPKGSGSRGKGQKGKSGVLFRAVEYCKWLEEGRDSLLQEVLRLEGILEHSRAPARFGRHS